MGNHSARLSEGRGLLVLAGLPFWKLTGSGNDFVFFDCRNGVDPTLLESATVSALCDRRRGVGADGIVLFEEPIEEQERYSIRYYNRDGTLAEMCGNAALCSVRLAGLLRVLGANDGEPFFFHSSSGRLLGRLRGLGAALDDPEISMPMPGEIAPTCDITRAPGEQRIGFARVGVPHLVVVVDDLEAMDVVARGRILRSHSSLRDGANVNFVRQLHPGSWVMRTYERGVEAETLACGSGAVAVAALVTEWGIEPKGTEVSVRTSGGRDLRVSWATHSAALQPFLRGEGRLVFSGVLGNAGLPPAPSL